MNLAAVILPYFPVFSKVLGLLEGKTVADIREQLDQDYKSTMLANWGVFVPAAVINLAFCPPELRVLFLNVRENRGRPRANRAFSVKRSRLGLALFVDQHIFPSSFCDELALAFLPMWRTSCARFCCELRSLCLVPVQRNYSLFSLDFQSCVSCRRMPRTCCACFSQHPCLQFSLS